MKKVLVSLLAVVAAVCSAVGAERMTTVPITGGFGVKLGEKFTPQLERSLRAKREKYADKTVIGYKIIPPKPIKWFTSYSVELTKDRRIYKIQAIYIGPDTDTPFSNAVFMFQKKYGMASGVRDELVFIDKQHPTRTIRITRGDYLSAVVYCDSAVGGSDNNDI